jgi:hypothetical protein
VTLALSRRTAPDRLLPSFLICGGQCCGTTSMYRALAAHPAVLEADHGQFPTRSDALRRSDRLAGVPVHTFASSQHYMYHPHAAGRIAADLPWVRVIVLLRDPVERAYSQHAHEVARGYEPERDFARALALEPSRLRGRTGTPNRDRTYPFAHRHHAYRGHGEYVRYLQPLSTVLGRDRIHVVHTEDFFTRPEPVYDAVLDFLDLPHLGYPRFERREARMRGVPMDPRIGFELERHYERFDNRLAAWLGRDLPWRR